MALALRHPTALFAVLSLLSGVLTIAVTPPLRGPDENAHFLRAYAISRGEVLARGQDEKGRKGVHVPPRIAADFDYFDKARDGAGANGTDYRAAFGGFAPAGKHEGAPVFRLYGGSEGYTPVPYLPYAAGGLLAGALDLGFLPTLYLMRVAGLVAFTALIAFAIAQTPALGWLFLAVAMLPSGLFARSIVSADGAVLASTLLVVALCLRALFAGVPGAVVRGVWITLCALTKPSQIAFAMLELMVRRFGVRNWLAAAAVIAPGVVLALAWPLVFGADIAAWRMSEADNVPPEQFQVGWKLRYMLANPLHFPAALLNSLDYAPTLWRQLIGVLGWLDMPLLWPAYPVLSVLLVAAAWERLALPLGVRMRVAFVASAAMIAYVLLAYALLYITVTPVASDRVIGVQGRYFTVVLPLAALIVAAISPIAIPERSRRLAAVLLAAISIAATVEAVLRVDWKIALAG